MESERINGCTIVLGNEDGTKHLLLLVVLCLSCLLVVVVVVRRGIAAGLPNAMQCCVVTNLRLSKQFNNALAASTCNATGRRTDLPLWTRLLRL